MRLELLGEGQQDLHLWLTADKGASPGVVAAAAVAAIRMVIVVVAAARRQQNNRSYRLKLNYNFLQMLRVTHRAGCHYLQSMSAQEPH